MWIVVSALGLVVTGSEEMQKTLLAMLRTVIPSVSDSLFSASMLSGISHTLTWTGLVTLAVFWWTVTGWMNSLRNAVTTMFDDCTQELNVVKRDCAIRSLRSWWRYCSYCRPRRASSLAA